MASQATPALESLEIARRLPAICFKLAGFTALIAVSIGLYMGISRDHSLAPVHVHLNLIGWVSMFLFGLFYDARQAAAGWTAVMQVALSAVGYVAMMAGLSGLLLSGDAVFMPLTVIGSFMVWGGFAMFFVIVLRTA